MCRPFPLRSRRVAGLSALATGLLLLAGCAPERSQPPDLVLLVVDTLRADRLTCGPEPQLFPETCAAMAERGVVFERAYASAPWTLPSMASMLTGLAPDALAAAGSTLYDVPSDAATLAERLRDAGYDTAAFVANPTLQGDSGFGDGFETFEVVEARVESLDLSAEHWLQPRLEEWLAQRSPGRPSFLWAHYLDPHDPYVNPDFEAGEFPDAAYVGPYVGSDVHGVYVGALVPEDPPAAARQFAGLYDGEARYLDRFLARTLAALERGRDLVVVLTSDHGEELHEHGGWKHGQTLYEEQVRVPLLVRWSSEGEAARVQQTVRGLDVATTLLAAAGVEPEGLEGRDLRGVAHGDGAGARPAFFQHHSSGPVRAGAVLGNRKQVWFNAADPTPEADPVAQHLLALDRQRLPRWGRFDLGTDPREVDPWARPTPEDVLLEREIHRRLLGTMPGLRVLVGGATEGPPIEVVLELAAEATAAPYFLAEPDVWAEKRRAGGTTIRLTVAGREGRTPLRGLLLPSGSSVQGVTATCSGQTVPLFVGAGHATQKPHAQGVPLEAAALEVRRSVPDAPAEPAVYVFDPVTVGPAEVAEPNEELRQRLQSLGYVQ